MHPFGPRETLTFLINDTLAQISIDPYSLQFSFESGTNVTAEFGVTFVAADGTQGYCDVQQQVMPSLTTVHDFISKVVTDIAVNEQRLDLIFSSGAVLQIHTDLGMYESGQIAASQPPVFIVF